MSKSARHPSLCSSLPCLSSCRSRRRRPRFQLLHDLPEVLFAEVCSFLSVHETVSTLRSTCHAIHGSVRPDCLLRSHLDIRDCSLSALLASTPGTRALVSRVSSLHILQRGKGQPETPSLQQLHSPLDSSRCLFSRLSSLRVDCCHWRCPEACCLLSLLQLLAEQSQSFSSLRRLHIAVLNTMVAAGELPFSSLAGLQALTHFRLDVRKPSALSWSPLLSALSSLPSLTFLDLADWEGACPQLLSLLCADAVAPLLLRLNTLALPNRWREHDDLDELHDAFLCRLSSLPAPPALQHLSAVSRVSYRAAGLLSIFSLPHLTQLHLPGWVPRRELATFVSTFTSAPAPLVSLVLPSILLQSIDLSGDEAAVREDAAAVGRVRLLLSRFTSLRRLCSHADMASGAVALPGSRPGDRNSGCSGSLYSLTVRHLYPKHEGFPLITPLSFPLLTELRADLPFLEDADMELLLSACPQLLRLDCKVPDSSKAVLTAARCCPCLLELTVRTVDGKWRVCAAGAAGSQPVVSPFLPRLISLTLDAWGTLHTQPTELVFSALRHFTSPPNAQLRRVRLEGRNLSAQHVLSLAELRLTYLQAHGGGTAAAAVEEARRRTWSWLHGTAGRDDVGGLRSIPCNRACEGRRDETPLGPHQQEEMRQRVGEAANWPPLDNLFSSVVGVDVDVDVEAVRAVFFAELGSVLAEAAASTLAGREG